MLKIGHRGAPGEPRVIENTLRSFQKARWSGADAIELDVRRAKDRTLVVIHDATVDRTTSSTGRVRDYTYLELATMDAGQMQRIPCLGQVFHIFGPTLLIEVEIKEGGLCDEIEELIKKYSLSGRVIISGFDADENDPDSSSSWEELRKISPRVPTALLVGTKKMNFLGEDGLIESAKNTGAFAISPHYGLVTPKLISDANREGLCVFAWTVNDTDVVQSLKGWGISGIISDCPELL